VRREEGVPGDGVPTDVVGYTCMEHDCLQAGCEQPLRPGDYVIFDNVGAYTVVMKPPFIQPAPAILIDDGAASFRLAKRAERLEDLFATYAF
jgi:diaminopimelate decarboxylase